MSGEPRQLDQAKVERLHSLLVGTEMQLTDIANHHQDIFGNALVALATFIVEKIYHCAPTVEDAAMMLAQAQEQGLENWVRAVEAEATKDESGIIVLDG